MSVTSMQETRRSQGRSTAAAAGVDLAAFVTSWQLSLEAVSKADDVRHITGWKTYYMVREYTAARGIARAHDPHARISPGDRI